VTGRNDPWRNHQIGGNGRNPNPALAKEKATKDSEYGQQEHCVPAEDGKPQKQPGRDIHFAVESEPARPDQISVQRFRRQAEIEYREKWARSDEQACNKTRATWKHQIGGNAGENGECALQDHRLHPAEHGQSEERGVARRPKCRRQMSAAQSQRHLGVILRIARKDLGAGVEQHQE